MAEEQTGIVLGKLAPPFKEGYLFAQNRLIPNHIQEEASRMKMTYGLQPKWDNDPLYFAAERKRKRRRV